MLVLALSSIYLLILPMSVLDGLIRWLEILSQNHSLWSLIEISASLSFNICIRSSSFNLLAICFYFDVYCFRFIVVTFFISFCYVIMPKLFVTGLFNSLYVPRFISRYKDIVASMYLSNIVI